jgi:hypothetical protein
MIAQTSPAEKAGIGRLRPKAASFQPIKTMGMLAETG